VGGVSTRNLNQLELFFLEVIEWDLFIAPEEYQSYNDGLQSYQSEDPQSPQPAGIQQ
jgi:hypothetical protein